ncbi:P-loop NTPase family protein [Marimonas lutisalis]|uniref:hypothetical protein n=1 Tax=Marimonas lutisalis TaxID=2545756 RepID=UPI0010F8B1C1|nr:hypothetical protein [Marimonas lutisalis]
MSSQLKTHQDFEPIAHRLENALDANAVPERHRTLGTKLLAHLRQPVRVVVAGPAGSGKSSVINMLLGQQVLATSGGPPITEVSYGATESVTFELEDGSTQSTEGLLGNLRLPDGVVRASQEVPLNDLKSLIFQEVQLDPNLHPKGHLWAQALAQANIVLWCTDRFTQAEQNLWAGVPDEIKDQGFLVLTKADQHMLRGTLEASIKALEEIVTEEFFGLYPLASIQGLKARVSNSVDNADLWRSSGGQSLHDEIHNRIECGRTAVLDNAYMLLAQLGDRGAEPAADTQCLHAARISDTPHGPADTQRAPSESAENRPFEDATAILDEAVRHLTRTGKELLEEIECNYIDIDDFLSRCFASIEALSAKLDNANLSDPIVKQVSQDVQEGEETMVLLQLERNEDAALDAVTILVQLKIEIAAIAAV